MIDWIGRAAIRRAVSLLPAVMIAISGVATMAQEQADEATDEELANAERFEISEDTFDSWVFRYGQTTATIRVELENQLDLRLDDLDRAGKLTDAQRSKLRLAGRSDIQQYFSAVEVVRRRFELIRKDRERFNEVWKEIQPLQMRLAAGLFESGSLFRKSLRKTVTEEHASRYEQTLRERRLFHYRAEVEWVVAMLDNVMPLDDGQRQKLIQLLLDKTKLPRISSEYDHYVVLWQLSRLPEDDLKSLLDDEQWKVLNQQFKQLKGVERFLKENGRLSLEGEPDVKEEAANKTEPASAK